MAWRNEPHFGLDTCAGDADIPVVVVYANTGIEFQYPITALIGPNGTNKSSVLRALQACPNQSNIGDYWFDTQMDRIDVPGAKNPHRYIHSYRAPSGAIAEVIKARVGNVSRGPDYFETSAPRVRDGMQPLPRNSPAGDRPIQSKTRWRPIEKDVVYLDFRQELPAYDIFMSFNWRKNDNDQSAKKKVVRKRSSFVQEALATLRSEHLYYGTNRILHPAEALSQSEVQSVSKVLGREYLEIRLLRHDYFGAEGYTASLKTARREYSEAYAGSGEFAAIMLVIGISRAAARSLILLDEPETSLHPGAQRELMRFLARETVQKKHQVVLATHSPAMVDQLPDAARKLFDVDHVSGRAEVVAQSATVAEAFSRVGADFAAHTVIVEDELAREFVLRAARIRGADFLRSLSVTVVPGGAETLIQRVAPVQAQVGANVLILLDGDKKPLSPYQPPRPASAVPDDELKLELSKFNIPDKALIRDGGNGNSERQMALARRTTYEWCLKHVSWLPGICSPDALLAEIAGAEPLPNDAKEYWRREASTSLGRLPSEDVTASEILDTQRRCLADASEKHNVFREILQQLQQFLD